MRKAAEGVAEMDRKGGHKTNLDKSSALAVGKGGRRIRAGKGGVVVAGEMVKVERQVRVVGCQVGSYQELRRKAADEKVVEDIRRIKAITQLEFTEAQKTRLVETAAIPVVVTGALWSLPTKAMVEEAEKVYVAVLGGGAE